jgi:hypothetical protein
MMAKTSRRRVSPPRKTTRSRAGRVSISPRRPTTRANVFTSKQIQVDFAGPGHRYNDAELEIIGIDHSQSSYEGRVFLNNPKADQDTPLTLENGYAGSFHILGHGGCFGDAGHCVVKGHREPYDFRVPHSLTPARKRVEVTEALRQATKTDNKVTITIVPVVNAANDLCDVKNVFHCEKMRLLTYDP